MIYIFSDHLTSRLEYIVGELFTNILPCAFKLSDNRQEYLLHDGPGINYSATSLVEHEIHIVPQGVLSETGLRNLDIGNIFEWNQRKAFFKTSENIISFDLFAASFVLLSRYEEYLPFHADKHLRFPAKESFLVQNNLIEEPLVDQWALELKKVILKSFPVFSFRAKTYKFISTVDVDVAYSHKGKGLLRNLLSAAKALLQANTAFVKEKLRTQSGGKDPYDTFDYIHKQHKLYNVSSVFFFLLGNYSDHDKNLKWNSVMMKSLVKATKDFTVTGIHPSYYVNDKVLLLKREIDRLSLLTEEPVEKCRMHYIRLRFPNTYRLLMKGGIKQDFSMGYPDKAGFRAGTCTPYLFYDLSTESTTFLKIFPFCLMDGVLKDYLTLSIEDAILMGTRLFSKVKEVNGTAIMVWHNQSLSEKEGWQGWKKVFEALLKTGAHE